jgi:hypothetical protein
MNATLLSEVLLGIASKSRFSQGLDIEFETKSGYKCFTHLLLNPQYYHNDHRSSKIEFSGYQHDFSVLFQIEKELNFSKWTRISFRDSDENSVGINENIIIGLSSDKYGEPHRSHYSGHLFISWMDYVDRGHRTHAETLEDIEKESKSRTKWQSFKRWVKEDVVMWGQ